MISFEDFDRYISIIRKDDEFISNATNLMRTDFFFENYQSIGLAVDLLSLLCHDTGEWISWWCFEADFGANDLADSATEADGTPIPLRTTRDLYDFLCASMKAGDKH